MKKKIVALLICVCLLASLCVVFAACNSENFKVYSVTYDFNGGSLTQEYRESHNMEEKSTLISVINAMYYEGATNILLKYSDMNAPDENKIFAGWYIDKELTIPWTKINFEAYMAEYPDTSSIKVHAKWINSGTLDIVYYVNSSDSSYKDTGACTKIINVSHLITESEVLAQAPAASNIQERDGYDFMGWQNQEGDIAARLNELALQNGQFLVSGVWYLIPNVSFFFSLSYVNENGQLMGYDETAIPVHYDSYTYTTPSERRDLVTSEKLTQFINDYKACLVLNDGYTSDGIVGWKIAAWNQETEKYSITDFTVANIVALSPSGQYTTDSYITVIPVFEN